MQPDYYDKLAERIDSMPEPKSANGHAQDFDAVVALRAASDVKMKPIDWVWSGWLASGKLHVLAGVPGLGKTTVALSLAATITRGGMFPDGSKCSMPGSVLIWSGEDGIDDTLTPRLAAMGADLSRVRFVEAVTEYTQESQRIVREFDPAQDILRLAAVAERLGDVRLLMIDPVSLTVAGDSNKNSEVRRGLAPLSAFAEHLGAAVIGISHFSKGTAGKDPLDRVTGSLAFGAAPRIVLGAARITEQGEDGEAHERGHVLVRIKSNIGPSGDAIEYQFDQVQIEGSITASRIVWGKTIDGSARAILAQAEQTDIEHDETSALEEAVDCLREILGDGDRHEANAVAREARSAGHAERTIRRAREALSIKPERDGHTRKWYWRLTRGGQQDGQNPQPKNDGHLGHLGQVVPQDGQGVQGGHVFGGGKSGHLSGHLADRETF